MGNSKSKGSPRANQENPANLIEFDKVSLHYQAKVTTPDKEESLNQDIEPNKKVKKIKVKKVKSQKLNGNQLKMQDPKMQANLREQILLKKLAQIKLLVNYAEQNHKSLEKDYSEIALAYSQVLNIYSEIVQDSTTSTEIKDWLFPLAGIWISKSIDLKNWFYTQQIQDNIKNQEAGAAASTGEEKIDFAQIVDDFLQSSNGDHISPKIKNKIFNFAKVLKLSRPVIKMSDVIGSQEAKLHAVETIIFTMRDTVLKKFRDGIPMGVVFYGQAGTGKSHLAKAIANEANCTFMEVKPTDIDDMYHGESGSHVEAIFHLARILQPSIIFLDEIDAMLPDRNDPSSKTDQKTISMFLNEMQGKPGEQVFVIGCTNNPDKLDSAFRRRFQRFIHVKMPSRQAQAQMMQKWYKGIDHTITKAEFMYMAEQLHDLAPTDIKKMMDYALTKKRSDFYHAKAHKAVVFLEAGRKYVACSPEDPLAIPSNTGTMNSLLDHPNDVAVQPITAPYLMNYIQLSKPAVDAKIYQKMIDFEKSLGVMC